MPASKSSSSDGARALKIIVISMGIALIGGTILLFALAFKKVGAEKTAKTTASVPISSPCTPQKLTLDAGEVATKLSYREGVTLVESILVDGAESLRIVDGCSGKVLQHLTLISKQED